MGPVFHRVKFNYTTGRKVGHQRASVAFLLGLSLVSSAFKYCDFYYAVLHGHNPNNRLTSKPLLTPERDSLHVRLGAERVFSSSMYNGVQGKPSCVAETRRLQYEDLCPERYSMIFRN